MSARRPPKGTPTDLNIWAGAVALYEHNGRIPLRMPPTDVPHLRRLIAAGWLVQDGDAFVPAPGYEDFWAREIAKHEEKQRGKLRGHESHTAEGDAMDEFTRAYFETALWSTNDESDEQGGEPLDANYGIEDIAPETAKEMEADCADFQERFGQLIEDDDPTYGPDFGRWGRAGHDFWLTRNGHGAGFWDGDWPKHGDELTDASKEYGEYHLYVGDDGLIYGEGYGARYRSAEAREAPRQHQVADFNTLEDLIAHAERELGATHVTVELIRGTGKAGRGTKIYFPRGGQYPYEEALVRRNGGYWHADGPGARTGIRQLPDNAMTIERYLTRGGRRREAAEAWRPSKAQAQEARRRRPRARSPHEAPRKRSRRRR